MSQTGKNWSWEMCMFMPSSSSKQMQSCWLSSSWENIKVCAQKENNNVYKWERNDQAYQICLSRCRAPLQRDYLKTKNLIFIAFLSHFTCVDLRLGWQYSTVNQAVVSCILCVTFCGWLCPGYSLRLWWLSASQIKLWETIIQSLIPKTFM